MQKSLGKTLLLFYFDYLQKSEHERINSLFLSSYTILRNSKNTLESAKNAILMVLLEFMFPRKVLYEKCIFKIYLCNQKERFY